MKRRKKYKIKKKIIIFFVILLIIGLGIFGFVTIRNKKQKEAKEKLESEIKKHYSSIVEVIKDATLLSSVKILADNIRFLSLSKSKRIVSYFFLLCLFISTKTSTIKEIATKA